MMTFFQTLFSKNHSQLNITRAEAGKVQDEPGVFCCTSKLGRLKESWRDVKWTLKPIKGTGTGQIKDNLTIKINNDNKGLQLTK